MTVPLMQPTRRLVCFNNFYYCRYGACYCLSVRGQYASIISTIVDTITITCLNQRLVCFNNFYYCRSHKTEKPRPRLVCFNNFYYCRYDRSSSYDWCRLVCFNNFYYCRYCSRSSFLHHGQYASIISTIVDVVCSLHTFNWLVCFNNFYYCRFKMQSLTIALGQYVSIISTIVDTKIMMAHMEGQYVSIISTIVDLTAYDVWEPVASMLQ